LIVPNENLNNETRVKTKPIQKEKKKKKKFQEKPRRQKPNGHSNVHGEQQTFCTHRIMSNEKQRKHKTKTKRKKKKKKKTLPCRRREH
jgi:hypothetical protein